jgi:protein-tyrosine phosphatase
MAPTTGILFVCMGNICRSPLAEGLFLHLARQRGVHEQFRVDSAGTGGWHAGNPADPRTIAVAHKRGVPVLSRARQVDPRADFIEPGPDAGFHWLIGMDMDNCERLIMLGAPEERVRLLRSFDPALAGEPPHRLEVPDPYYGGPDGFELMYAMINSACEGLLASVTKRP